MKSALKILATAALICAVAACTKDDGSGKNKRPTDFSGGCEAIDLGLSVKWASYNVGAKNPNGTGAYFAWGETEDKEQYGWLTVGAYKWGVYDKKELPLLGMNKYTGNVEGGDGLTKLLPEDDPATANWGTKWRTPTWEELKELLDKDLCTWTWDSKALGCWVKGPNGNSIFLRAAGVKISAGLRQFDLYGYYGCSTLKEDSIICFPTIFFTSAACPAEGYEYRNTGYTIRAVSDY